MGTALARYQLKQTTCPYCGVGCDIETLVATERDNDSRLTQLRGMTDHPANFGRLCVKGSNLLQTNNLDNRLLAPRIGDKTVNWPTAIEHVASKFSQIIQQHGPDAVAFYVSGQLLTEDYYVANKLMKGYIGSANIDTNSRLCMSSAVAAYKRAFGADAVPCCYEDLEQTELLVLVGSNAAWTHPVLYQRVERARQLNPTMRVVLIDPRRTASAELASLHLPIKSGTDVALFNGLLSYIAAQQLSATEYIQSCTEGFSQCLQLAQQWTPQKVAHYCDIELDLLLEFYQHFASTDKVVSLYSMGVNQSSNGTDKANAIINCHLATGTIGREGCGPFSITGQPNAMGGREVGGMANMLAAHMELENPDHRQLVQQFWQSPTIASQAGLKAVDLFDAISQGKVKAVWIMATNPMVSMPNRDKIATALQQCELVVVSDCVANNDTLAYADVALPATGWSEKNGTVTNSERCISRQRGLLPPAGKSRHDWQIICDVAQAMGFDQGFNFSHPAQIFSEHAALTGYRNNGQRDLDLSALSELDEVNYDLLKPVQWPVNRQHPQGSKRLFADGRFFTPSGKARFIAVTAQSPVQSVCTEYPLVLNSGRMRDQWHSMTRTGKAYELNRHSDQATLAIHPQDAQDYQLHEGDLVTVSSAHSRREQDVILPVALDPKLRRGELFAPIHWNAMSASSANISRLYADSRDPLSGQPELKHSPVQIKKVAFDQYASLVLRNPVDQAVLNSTFVYWTQSKLEHGYLYRLAFKQADFNWLHWQQQLGIRGGCLCQKSGHNNTGCVLYQQQLQMAWFSAPQPQTIDPSWLDHMLGLDQLDSQQYGGLLRIEPDPQFLLGPVICSCFNVAKNTIVDAIKQGTSSVETLGDKLKCGTNCGSCKSELAQLLSAHSVSRFVSPQQRIEIKEI